MSRRNDTSRQTFIHGMLIETRPITWGHRDRKVDRAIVDVVYHDIADQLICDFIDVLALIVRRWMLRYPLPLEGVRLSGTGEALHRSGTNIHCNHRRGCD